MRFRFVSTHALTCAKFVVDSKHAGFSLVFSATGMAPFQTGKAIG